MQGEATGEIQKPLTTRPPFWEYARRVITRAYWVVGGIANVLGIYGFGESHHWWEFTFTASSETKEVFWMLAVGVGGPWAMMLAGIAGAKFCELFTSDQTTTLVIIRSVVRVSSFFAILHCAEMSFDIKIFPLYLNSEGFVKVVGLYLLLGLAVGTVFPLIIYMIKRIVLLRRGGGQPHGRADGNRQKTRFRRSPS